MKTVQEIIEWLKDRKEDERERSKEAREHMWTAAVTAMDLCEELLEFIDEPNETA